MKKKKGSDRVLGEVGVVDREDCLLLRDVVQGHVPVS